MRSGRLRKQIRSNSGWQPDVGAAGYSAVAWNRTGELRREPLHGRKLQHRQAGCTAP